VSKGEAYRVAILPHISTNGSKVAVVSADWGLRGSLLTVGGDGLLRI